MHSLPSRQEINPRHIRPPCPYADVQRQRWQLMRQMWKASSTDGPACRRLASSQRHGLQRPRNRSPMSRPSRVHGPTSAAPSQWRRNGASVGTAPQSQSDSVRLAAQSRRGPTRTSGRKAFSKASPPSLFVHLVCLNAQSLPPKLTKNKYFPAPHREPCTGSKEFASQTTATWDSSIVHRAPQHFSSFVRQATCRKNTARCEQGGTFGAFPRPQNLPAPPGFQGCPPTRPHTISMEASTTGIRAILQGPCAGTDQCCLEFPGAPRSPAKDSLVSKKKSELVTTLRRRGRSHKRVAQATPRALYGHSNL